MPEDDEQWMRAQGFRPPTDLRPEIPHPARIYDWFLGATTLASCEGRGPQFAKHGRAPGLAPRGPLRERTRLKSASAPASPVHRRHQRRVSAEPRQPVGCRGSVLPRLFRAYSAR